MKPERIERKDLLIYSASALFWGMGTSWFLSMAENFNFGYDLFDSLSSDWLTYRKVSPIFLVLGRVSSSAFGEKIRSDSIWQIAGQRL